ncbi:MAG: Gfo/Idh/MocA family oxidoreductase [Bacteroidia bacterium]|nr:Gfo/Idh/MocA family oxidoreductase [Bacteroidia bacterium]
MSHSSQTIRLGIIGAGFWSQYQIAGWKELSPVNIVAICDKDPLKAKAAAKKHGIPRYFTDAAQMMDELSPDVVDIITDVDSHALFVEMAAKRKIAAISQKPMGPDLHTATQMVKTCREANVPFFVHENFRFQEPIRQVKAVLDQGIIGKPFKARVSFCSNYPVFQNQPFLAQLEQFILTDIGSHILDIIRYLLGEAKSLYCQTHSINPGIKGEDVANVFLVMEKDVHCFVEMSYASILEKELFPQTLVEIEGSEGSLALEDGYILRVTTKSGTTRHKIDFHLYFWASAEHRVIHASIVETHRNILEHLLGKKTSEITGEDNLKTVELFFKCYDSAAKGTIISLYPHP